MNIFKEIKKIYYKKWGPIILKVDGGLGSCILQYALGMLIKEKTNRKILFDCSYFSKVQKTLDGKDYVLQFPYLFKKAKFLKASSKLIKFYKKNNFLIENKKNWAFNSTFFENRNYYLSGYASHYKYWFSVEKKIQKELNFSEWEIDKINKEIKNEIINEFYPIAVHVRRGDFVNLGWDSLSKEYYIKAINYFKGLFKNKCKFYFFSNDYDYVKNEIIQNCQGLNFKLISNNDHNHGYLDLMLMSLCKGFVIANSTFSISSVLLSKYEYVNKEMLNMDLQNIIDKKIVISPDSFCYIGNNFVNQQNDMKEAIQNPDFIIFDHKSGERIC